MLSIQDVGLQIFEKRPLKFYVFGGAEYGIKQNYIEMLKDQYSQWKECESVLQILDLMEGNHLFGITDCLYIVRYDDTFIKLLDNKLSERINSCNIHGTIVCIVESQSHEDKCGKYLPDNTVIISEVPKKLFSKYIHNEFPKLCDEMVSKCVEISINYSNCKCIAASWSKILPEVFLQHSDSVVESVFSLANSSTDELIRIYVASRDFRGLMSVLDSYEGDLDNFLYTMLNAVVEIEKLLSNTYIESSLREHLNRWSREDTYNMFMQIYRCISKLRTVTSDKASSIMYVASLLPFEKIPSIELL